MANVGRTELMESVARRHDIAVSIGRRKVSSARLEDLVSDHDLRWKELCDMQRKSENSKKDIREQIDKWELEMIGRIRVKADQARDKLAQLTDIEANTVIDKAQGLTREMNTRDVELDVLKDNLEQLKESTDAMKKVKEQFIKLGNIELYTEPHHMIDWNHLIYVRKQSITAAPEKERVQTVKDNYTHQDAAIDDDELDEKPTPTRDVASANSMTTYERWRDRIPGVADWLYHLSSLFTLRLFSHRSLLLKPNGPQQIKVFLAWTDPRNQMHNLQLYQRHR